MAVVNNDKDFLDAIQILLTEHAHYNVVIHHEGKTAYKRIVDEQPDLVILDIRLDNPTTGWKVLDLLRLDPKGVHIPVIICSASMQEIREKEKWLAEHEILVLPKPFDVDDLLMMVTKSLEPPKSRAVYKEKELN